MFSLQEYQPYIDLVNFLNRFIQQSPQLHEIFITALKHMVLTGIALFPESAGRALYWIGKLDFLRFEPAFQINPNSELVWTETAPDGKIFIIFTHDLYVNKDGVVEVKCYFDNKLLCWTPRVYNDLFPRPRKVLLPCKLFKVEMINHDPTDTVTIQHVVEYSIISEQAWNAYVSKLKMLIDKILQEIEIPL